MTTNECTFSTPEVADPICSVEVEDGILIPHLEASPVDTLPMTGGWTMPVLALAVLILIVGVALMAVADLTRGKK